MGNLLKIGIDLYLWQKLLKITFFLVNGDWGAWTRNCVAGSATGTKTRLCDTPPPQHGGSACSGDASVVITDCPGKVP